MPPRFAGIAHHIDVAPLLPVEERFHQLVFEVVVGVYLPAHAAGTLRIIDRPVPWNQTEFCGHQVEVGVSAYVHSGCDEQLPSGFDVRPQRGLQLHGFGHVQQADGLVAAEVLGFIRLHNGAIELLPGGMGQPPEDRVERHIADRQDFALLGDGEGEAALVVEREIVVAQFEDDGVIARREAGECELHALRRTGRERDFLRIDFRAVVENRFQLRAGYVGPVGAHGHVQQRRRGTGQQLRLHGHVQNRRVRRLVDPDIDEQVRDLRGVRRRRRIAEFHQALGAGGIPTRGRAIPEDDHDPRQRFRAVGVLVGVLQRVVGGGERIGDRRGEARRRGDGVDFLVRIRDVVGEGGDRLVRVEDGHARTGREVVEELVGAALGLVESGNALHLVAHARAGVDDQHRRDRLLAEGGEERAAPEERELPDERGFVLLADFGLEEREGEEKDQQHPQGEEQEVAQPHLALVGLLLLHQEAQRREDELLRLLLHDEVKQHRQPDERYPGDQNRMHGC